MPAISPVSDLKNYTSVLSKISDGSPVFLTKNGRGAYAIVSINDYEKLNAAATLSAELQQGEKSAKNSGWITGKNVRKILGR